MRATEEKMTTESKVEDRTLFAIKIHNCIVGKISASPLVEGYMRIPWTTIAPCQ